MVKLDPSALPTARTQYSTPRSLHTAAIANVPVRPTPPVVVVIPTVPVSTIRVAVPAATDRPKAYVS